MSIGLASLMEMMIPAFLPTRCFRKRSRSGEDQSWEAIQMYLQGVKHILRMR